MSLDVRMHGLEFVLQNVDAGKLGFSQIQFLVDTYERHYDFYEHFRRGFSDLPEAHFATRRYMTNILTEFRKMYEEGTL